jgi:hypothetical protein
MKNGWGPVGYRGEKLRHFTIFVGLRKRLLVFLHGIKVEVFTSKFTRNNSPD